MCLVSAIADDWRRRHPPYTLPDDRSRPFPSAPDGPSRSDFELLRLEVIELKRLLIEAKKRDAAEGNPDCEMEEKIEVLRHVADVVGVDLDEVFGVPA